MLKPDAVERALFPVFGKVEVKYWKDVVYGNLSIAPLGLIFREQPIEVVRQSVLGTQKVTVLGWSVGLMITSGGLTEPEYEEEIDFCEAHESLEVCISTATSMLVAKEIFQKLLDESFAEELHANTH